MQKEKHIIIIGVMLAVVIIVIYLLMFDVSGWYGNKILSGYDNNSTLAQVHSNTANSLLLTFVTFLYVFLTGVLVIQSKESINKSNESIAQAKEAIVQSKKDQQIRDIEKRLENFYCPLSQRLGSYNTRSNHRNYLQFERLLRDTSSYIYLTISEDVKSKFKELITCQRNSCKTEADTKHIDNIIAELLKFIDNDIKKLENDLNNLKNDYIQEK